MFLVNHDQRYAKTITLVMILPNNVIHITIEKRYLVRKYDVK